jgi:hypothetical protein
MPVVGLRVLLSCPKHKFVPKRTTCFERWNETRLCYPVGTVHLLQHYYVFAVCLVETALLLAAASKVPLLAVALLL